MKMEKISDLVDSYNKENNEIFKMNEEKNDYSKALNNFVISAINIEKNEYKLKDKLIGIILLAALEFAIAVFFGVAFFIAPAATIFEEVISTIALYEALKNVKKANIQNKLIKANRDEVDNIYNYVDEINRILKNYDLKISRKHLSISNIINELDEIIFNEHVEKENINLNSNVSLQQTNYDSPKQLTKRLK